MTGRLKVRNVVLILVSLLILLTSCGKVKQAKNLMETAIAIAETEVELSDDESGSINWENIDLTDKDIRKFYSGVETLNRKYPEMEFEIALTASLHAMSQGLNLEKIIKEETDMSFSEYNGLSAAILLTETNEVGLFLVDNMVASLEESLVEYQTLDTSVLIEEEKAESEPAINDLRADLASAKEEMESPEFRKQYEKSKLVLSIREEMGL
jgi:hypothetical protein